MEIEGICKSDSEDEIEERKEEEEASVSRIELTGALPTQPFVLAITSHGNASALFEIIQHNNMTEIGKGLSTHKGKEETTLLIYSCKGSSPIVWIEVQDCISGGYCNQLTESLFG